MKSKLRIACVALLATAAMPAWALQLGQIQVKSALNQPLVAAIPLHPKNLTELDGLTVGLASAADFARAGLQVTPTDQTLGFHVVTDNNGQKLILVTSSQPITDPYLDFLVQVNTRQGKQVREFVVLLNPVIAAPAPEVRAAPVASAAPGNAQAPQPAQLPPSSAFAQPTPQPESTPAAQSAPEPKVSGTQPVAAPPPPPPPPPSPQAPALQAGGTVPVAHGDTLYNIAKEQGEDTRSSINQMMLALKAANPEAFFKDNINDLKAGAILRIPTRDEVDSTSVAEANAEVHRQYEAWRAARPHPATVVEGTAAEAAANAAPKPGNAGPASDHLTLAPPTGEAGGASNRPGVAGGTGKETVTGLRQQLQNDRGSLISLNQSNADLQSRVRSLEDITAKSDKLLSLKDGTIAELQRKLAAMQAGKSGVAGATSVAGAAASAVVPAASNATGAANASAKPGAKAANTPAQPSSASGPAWFNRPLTWIVAGLIVLALVLFGLLRRRRGGPAAAPSKGPLPDPEDIAPPQPEVPDEEDALRARLAEHADDIAAHLALCRLYYKQGDEPRFVEAAKAMRAHVSDPESAEWREVTVMGEELAPHLPLFETPVEAHADPYGMVALRRRVDEGVTEAQPRAQHEPDLVGEPQPDGPAYETPAPASMAHAEVESEPAAVSPSDDETEFADDPVDTKLDLARAYLDMGDPVGARAMLDEVLDEGSQAQKDEAKRLLADVTG